MYLPRILSDAKGAYSDREKLQALANQGIRVEPTGSISNWKNWPPPLAAPSSTSGAAQPPNVRWTEAEMELLRDWVGAAELEEPGGASRYCIYEQLEALCPTRPWTTFREKVNKNKQEFLPPAGTEISCDTPFPNLSSARRAADTPEALPTIQISETSPVAGVSRDVDHGMTTLSPGPSTDMQHDTETVSPDPSGDEADPRTFRSLKPSVMANVLRELGLSNEAAFRDWLAADWVLDVYDEYNKSILRMLKEKAKEMRTPEGHAKKSRVLQSQNQAQIDQAVQAITKPIPHYLMDDPEKEFWTPDDHAVRFITRLVNGGRESGRLWEGRTDLPILCEKAQFFMRWLHWLCSEPGGNSPTQERERRRRGIWRSFLLKLQGQKSAVLEGSLAVSIGSPLPGDPVCGFAQGLPTCSNSTDQANILSASAGPEEGPVEDRPQGLGAPPWSGTVEDVQELDTMSQASGVSNTSVRNETSQVLLPSYIMPRSRTREEQEGAFLISAQAMDVYRNRRDQMLNSWGVTSGHRGTCVLVPHAWRQLLPEDLIPVHNVQSLNMSEPEEQRLTMTIADKRALFSRFVAFFERTSRRGIDLDVFIARPNAENPEIMDGPGIEMQGSHLCHHGLCVLPEHIVWESKSENLSRLRCSTFAKHLRSYCKDAPMIRSCKWHTPPCFLQHASLTTQETFLIQFSVWRQARGLESGQPPVPRPIEHPFDTWEPDLPLHMSTVDGLSDVVIDSRFLSRPRIDGPEQSRDRYKFTCSFCTRVECWNQIGAFWSHVKLKHPDVEAAKRLEEIVKQSGRYLEWLRDRGYESSYKSKDVHTYCRMQQTQQAEFDWHTFTGWSLRHDTPPVRKSKSAAT